MICGQKSWVDLSKPILEEMYCDFNEITTGLEVKEVKQKRTAEESRGTSSIDQHGN